MTILEGYDKVTDFVLAVALVGLLAASYGYAAETGTVPEDEAARAVRMGIAKANAGQLDEAVEIFTQSMQMRKRTPAAPFNRGKVYLIQGHLDKAIRDFDSALKLDPNLSGAYESRGLVFKLRGDFARADKDLTKAIKLDSANTSALMTRAALYFDGGEPERALADLNEVIRIRPDMIKALGNRAYICEQLGRFDEAIKDLTGILAQDTGNLAAMKHLGLVFVKVGDTKNAARWFRLALKHEQDEAVREMLKSELARIEQKKAQN